MTHHDQHDLIRLFFINILHPPLLNNDQTRFVGSKMSVLGAHGSDTVIINAAGDKVLLGVAWCREDERTLFEKHPQVVMFDVIMDANREGRALGVMGSMDCNMEVFTPVRVIMPSQKVWVFDWIFKNAIPTLMGREPLKQTAIILTDGDQTMHSQVDANMPKLHPLKLAFPAPKCDCRSHGTANA